MKTLLGLVVALSITFLAAPVSAGPNDPLPGAAAPQAAPGDLGMAIMSAVVFSGATLDRGEGVVNVLSLGVGFYEVAFGRDVTACAYAPTLSGATFNSPIGTIIATKRSGNPNGLFIATRDIAGAPANSDFHVIVYCGR